MDVAGVDIIVDAVVGKSLRKQDGCNSYIFDKVKQRVRKEVTDLVIQGQSQLDVILLQKKRLQAMFCSERLLYETVSKKVDAVVNDKEKTPEETLSETPKEMNNSKNGQVKVLKTEEKKPERQTKPAEKQTTSKQTTSKQYFDYLAEYKNDIDVYDRVKGLEIRGKGFPISNDGSCPRCSYKSNVFVVLDFLFPAGDMPEILHYLLTLGKAVLWSSKENVIYKDPPIFLCQGKCPADIGKCGFNINWKTTDIDKIFLFPHENYKEKPKAKVDKAETLTAVKLVVNNDGQSTTAIGICEESPVVVYDASSESDMDTDETEEEYDEGHVDIEYYKKKVSWVVLDEVTANNIEDVKSFDEEAIIRNMLALEEARVDYINGEMKKKVYTEECMQKSVIRPSTNYVKEKRVNSVVNDINHKLQKSKSEDLYRLNSTPKPLLENEDYNRFHFPPRPPKPEVFTNAGSAAFAIANRDNCKIFNLHNSAEKEEKTKKPNTSTPTYILKGATYYDTKEVKASKPAFTVHDFPISKDGVCPYCHSSDVVYIILQEDGDVDELPELLERLHNEGKAVKRKKGEYDLPSFQCKGCTYGFNLDWKSTNLEKIFPKHSVVTSLPLPPPPPYTDQNSCASTSAYNVNSYNYGGYTNASGQYMYNSYQQQPYSTSTAPYAMSTYGFTQPVISYQALAPYQRMSRMINPYSNYMQHQQYGTNTITNNIPIDFSIPPPGFHEQSFHERFPPPLMNTEYTNPPPPPASTSSFNRKYPRNYKKITPDLNENKPTEEKLKTNESTVDSNAVDMDLDQDDNSAVNPVLSSSGGKTETESDSASELYDPFADSCNDQSANEDETEACPIVDEKELSGNTDATVNSVHSNSPKNENNSENDSRETPTVPSPPKVVKRSRKNEIVEDEKNDIQNCQNSSNSEKNVKTNSETDVSTTKDATSSDTTSTEPPKITPVRGKRTSTRKSRKSKGSSITDTSTINSITNCIDNEDSKNSDTPIINSVDDIVENDDTNDLKDSKNDINMSSNDNPASLKVDSELIAESVVEAGDDVSDTELVEDKLTQKDKVPQKGAKRKAVARTTKRGRRGRPKKRK